MYKINIRNNHGKYNMHIKKKSILLLSFIFIVLSGCITLRMDSLTGEDTASEVRANGLPATATVLKIWETGIRINNNPVVGFLLEVHAEGLLPYKAETKALISILRIPQIQPGATLKVKYNPDDPMQVALDIWEENRVRLN